MKKRSSIYFAKAKAAHASMTDSKIQELINWSLEEKIPAPGMQPPVITEEDEIQNHSSLKTINHETES